MRCLVASCPQLNNVLLASLLLFNVSILRLISPLFVSHPSSSPPSPFAPPMDSHDDAVGDQFNAISDSPSVNLKLDFPTHKNTLSTTVISYVCTTVGAGIISLPFALAESGWLGVLLIAITAVVCVQTANWLVACMYSQDEPLTSYEAIGVAAMGRPGKVIVALFQNITLFGVCCIFLIIAGGNLSALVPSLSMHAWVLICGCVLIPASWLKTVKEIKPLAWFGLFASLLVGLVIIITGLETAATTSVDEAGQPIVHDWLRWDGVSTCINIVVFSLGSHSSMPNQVSLTTQLRWSVARAALSAGCLLCKCWCAVLCCDGR